MDDKNLHGDGDSWGFSLFGEGMRTILYQISYLGRVSRQFYTKFLIQGMDGDNFLSNFLFREGTRMK